MLLAALPDGAEAEMQEVRREPEQQTSPHPLEAEPAGMPGTEVPA
jgi:hypothetical protein